MTGITFVAEAIRMNIPDRVTIYTLLGCVLVLALQMAGIAGNLLM